MLQVTEIKHLDSRGTPARGSKAVPKKDYVDPLSSGDPLGADGAISLAFEGADPLSRFAAEVEPTTKARSGSEKVLKVLNNGMVNARTEVSQSLKVHMVGHRTPISVLLKLDTPRSLPQAFTSFDRVNVMRQMPQLLSK